MPALGRTAVGSWELQAGLHLPRRMRRSGNEPKKWQRTRSPWMRGGPGEVFAEASLCVICLSRRLGPIV